MTQELADYIEAGKELDADERLEAAHQLLLSVDHDSEIEQADLEVAWGAVIDRRVTDMVSGNATLVDGREGLARIRAELAARRK